MQHSIQNNTQHLLARNNNDVTPPLSSHVADGNGGRRLHHESPADGVLPPAQAPRVQFQRRRVDADAAVFAGARDADAESRPIACAGDESWRTGECERGRDEYSDSGWNGEEL